MKYIRTENGIYEITNQEEKERIFGLYWYKDYTEEEFDKLIVKQADTIEELCDEFVLADGNNSHTLNRYLKEVCRYRLFLGAGKGTIYGAIWTSKGLIYVAKLNSKGELELI